MRIAVTYDNGLVFQHFGHTKQFQIFDVQDGQVVKEEIVPAGDSGHGALAGFLKGLGVDALICGGIGMGAKNALAQAGITLYGGVSGQAGQAVQELLAGSLQYSGEANCDHHGHGHGAQCGGGGHTCGHTCHG